MADYEYTNTTANSFDAAANRTYTLTFNGQERQIFLMALGELLGSVKREEHLTSAIEELISRVQSVPAHGAPHGSPPDPVNRTTDED